MAAGIYKFTNKINGKSYIGQSINLTRRKNQHKNVFLKPNSFEYDSPLHVAFREYGYDNFFYEILEECSLSDLNQKEKEWIKFYNSFEDGYNRSPGGTDRFRRLNKAKIDNIFLLLKETRLEGKEIGRLNSVSDQTISDINNGRLWKIDGVTYPIRQNRSPKKTGNFCIDCGKKISAIALRCRECESFCRGKMDKPDKQTLLLNVSEYGFSKVGRSLGVSATTIKKWCKKYDILSLLPSKKEKNIVSHKKPQEHSVYQINPFTGDLISVYKSIHEAQRATGTHRSNIQRVCSNKGKTANGFYWRYVQQ